MNKESQNLLIDKWVSLQEGKMGAATVSDWKNLRIVVCAVVGYAAHEAKTQNTPVSMEIIGKSLEDFHNNIILLKDTPQENWPHPDFITEYRSLGQVKRAINHMQISLNRNGLEEALAVILEKENLSKCVGIEHHPENLVKTNNTHTSIYKI